MGKLDLLQIEFTDINTNPHSVYKAGQLVSFNVRVKINQPIKCRGIYAKIFGQSRVKWTEHRQAGNTHYVVVYSSEETYIDVKTELYTPPTSGPNADHHPVGEYLYPVQFQLPQEVPSSFEGEHGKIRYSIRINIDKPWKFDDYTMNYFTVLRDLDLNLEPDLGPFSTADHFNVNCCRCCHCCGEANCTVEIPKKGFVPGEIIPFNATIHNTSQVAFRTVAFEIFQMVSFITKSKTRVESRAVSETVLEALPRAQRKQYGGNVYVKPVPSSDLRGCNNIDIKYFFRVHGDGGCCVTMRHDCCELIIGSIPMSMGSIFPPPQAVITQQPGAGYSNPGFSAGYDPANYGMQLSAPMTLVPPPPSYEECMFGPREMDKEEGRAFGNQGPILWAPRYTVYHAEALPVKEHK